MEDSIFTLIDYSRKKFNFSSLFEFISFIECEIRTWRDFNSINFIADNKENYRNNKKEHSLLYFNNMMLLLDDLNVIKRNAKNSSDGDFLLRENKETILKRIDKANYTWLWSGHEYSPFFLSCVYKYGQTGGDAFLDYICYRKIPDKDLGFNYDGFNGFMIAFLFSNKEFTNVERLKLSRAEQLITELTKKKDSLNNEISYIKHSNQSLFDSISEKLQNNLDNIEKHRIDSDEKLQSINEVLLSAKENVIKLEHSYSDKLRLSKPAEYWNNSACAFKKQSIILGILTLMFIIIPVAMLFISGKTFILDWFPVVENANIVYNIPRMGIVVFMLAIYTYLVRLLAKLTFSSLHLMRDAQEREQLTYVYLSLINENGIDEKSRDIVLQALFSRTETGLLANENGPTMPLSDVLQAMKK